MKPWEKSNTIEYAAFSDMILRRVANGMAVVEAHANAEKTIQNMTKPQIIGYLRVFGYRYDRDSGKVTKVEKEGK